ncbi:MAG TPA: zinc ribbon domain-containing protein [Rhodothermales bacterium]|nr:zinc ribbon domain-containing protein [Rhodothermales bacterium]
MPTYVYKREDGSTFEIEQRITEPALEVCPTTGQPVRRIPSASAGLVFKGSGFYLTDYARKGGEGGNGKASPDAASTEKPTGTGTAGDPGVSATGGTGTAGASTPGSVGST